MVATLEGIARILKQHNLPCEAKPSCNFIKTVVGGRNIENFEMGIRVTDGGQYVEILTPPLFALKNHLYKGVMFQAMLGMMGQSKLLRWSYEAGTGGVSASVPVLVGAEELTEQKLMLALGTLVQTVDEVGAPRLLTILKTGHDPGSIYDLEQLVILMRRLLPQDEWEKLQKEFRSKLAKDDEH